MKQIIVTCPTCEKRRVLFRCPLLYGRKGWFCPHCGNTFEETTQTILEVSY